MLLRYVSGLSVAVQKSPAAAAVVAAPFHLMGPSVPSRSPQVVGAVVRKHPISTLGIPLLVLAVLIALGIYGVLAGSASLANSNKDTAYSLAVDTSQAFTLYVEKVSRCMGVAMPCLVTQGRAGGRAGRMLFSANRSSDARQGSHGGTLN